MPRLGPFTFEEGGRTYECTPESRGDPSRGSWWWFTVSNDSQRYARFEATAGDTRKSVRARIVEYYEHRLWVRAQPDVPRQRFGHPVKPPAPPAAPEPEPEKG
jgi:hypothetical protein